MRVITLRCLSFISTNVVVLLCFRYEKYWSGVRIRLASYGLDVLSCDGRGEPRSRALGRHAISYIQYSNFIWCWA